MGGCTLRRYTPFVALVTLCDVPAGECELLTSYGAETFNIMCDNKLQASPTYI